MHEGRLRGAVPILAGLVFVLPSAVLMGYGAFFAEADTWSRLTAFGLFILLAGGSLVLLTMVYKAAFAQRIARRRWRRIGAELTDLGFRLALPHEVEETLGIPVSVLAPPVLAVTRGGGVDHVIVGRVGGRDLRCFNVRLRGSSWLDVPAAALRADASFPRTSIRPVRSSLPSLLDMDRVRYEHGGFNRSVGVFSIDAYFASALVDARMMEWLLANLEGAVVELADRWIVIWGIRRRFRGRRPLELLDLLVAFAHQMPRVVPSLFPEDDFYTFWVHRRRRARGVSA